MNFDNSLLVLAEKLADLAGEILVQHYQQPVDVERKADASPVTMADKEAERIMREAIMQHYPQHGIVGEEYGLHNPQAEYQWVLDPIDGTRAFIAGKPTFTTLIALTYRDNPILGVINQPISKERWIGYNNSSRKNDTALQASRQTTLADATIATTSMDYFTDDERASFEHLKGQCAQCIEGGDAYLYAKLAEGEIDAVIDAGLKPYDFCALPPVVSPSGGLITDWQGKPLTLKSGGQVVAAANKALHEKILNIIS